MQNDRLTKFLYLLVSRHVSPDTLNQIVSEGLPLGTEMPDKHLARWAEEMADCIVGEPNAVDADGPHHDPGPAKDSEQRLTLGEVTSMLGCAPQILIDQFNRGATIVRARNMVGVMHNIERVGPRGMDDTTPPQYRVTVAEYQGEDREG